MRVFRRALEVERVSDILMSLGRVEPNWALAGVYGHTISDRYFGLSACTVLYVNTNSLKSILRATGSQ